jgi:lipopolysaccharide transport system ATP-binding protein
LERGRISHSGPSDTVVARYLSLPRPDQKLARFIDPKLRYQGVSGNDWEISLVVSVSAPNPVEIAFSIEMLRLGIGWEILLLSKFHPVAATIGAFKVTIRIPQLPLAPGEFLLNLFLRARADDGLLVNCDTLGWTFGSGIALTVRGNPCRTPTRLPVTWQRRVKPDA